MYTHLPEQITQVLYVFCEEKLLEKSGQGTLSDCKSLKFTAACAVTSLGANIT